jgi:uncharacterized protein (DUF302 family)
MKTEEFAYIVETNKNFEEAVVSVMKEVDKKNGTLLHIHDMKERLAAKGFNQPPLKLIEICFGKYANSMLNKNRLTSLCLPCKINVMEENGKIKIVMMKPTMMPMFFPEVDAKEALEVENILKEIVDNSK